MKLKEFIQRMKFAFSETDVEKLAEQGVEKIKETVEDVKTIEDEEIQLMVDTAYDQYQALTKNMSKEEKGEFVKKFAILMVEKKGIPYDVAYNYIIAMTEEKGIDNKYILDSAKKLPDAKISKLISEEDINLSLAEREKLAVEGIVNPELKDEKLEEIEEERKLKEAKEEKEDIKKLEEFYSECDGTLGDWKFVEKLQTIMKSVRRTTPRIEDVKRKIIAKKIAHNYAKNGTSTIYILKSIMPAMEMGKVNIPELAKNEYEKIKKNTKNIKAFNEQDLRNNILTEIEKDAEKQFNEREAFAELQSMLRILSVEERKIQIENMKEIVKDSKLRATVEQTKGLLSELSKVPEEKRIKLIDIIQKSVEEKVRSVEKEDKTELEGANIEKETQQSLNITGTTQADDDDEYMH